jgi:hypothetical protein
VITKLGIAYMSMNNMTLTGLKINRWLIEDVIDNAGLTRSKGGSGSSPTAGVSEYSIETTRREYPRCRCEDLGLFAGMTVYALMRLGAGCTAGPNQVGSIGWVCPRLVKIRRMHGK